MIGRSGSKSLPFLKRKVHLCAKVAFSKNSTSAITLTSFSSKDAFLVGIKLYTEGQL